MFSKKRTLFFKMLFSSLVRRKSRMLTALLAVAIGAAVLMGMMTVYRDIPEQMGREMRSYGANMIFVPAEGKTAMNLSVIESVVKEIPQEKIVGTAPWRYKSLTMNHLPLTGAGTDFLQVEKTRPYWQVDGNYPKNDNEILVGHDIAEMTKLKPGDAVNVAGRDEDGKPFRQELTIAGILKTGGKEDGFVFLDLHLLNGLLETPDTVEIMELSIAASAGELELYRQHIERDTPDIVPRLVKRITRSETTVLEKLQMLVYLVTAVILMLTMICVTTTMMAMVMERRKEISLKKAIGAENRSIVSEFMGTGIVLGVLGGCLGCVMGYFFASAISFSVFGRSVSIVPAVIVITLGLSVVVTVIACILPVRRAVRIEPALVLRGE